MRSSLGIFLAAVCSILAACAGNPQLPVFFGDNLLTAGSGRVGVAMTAVPKVDTSFPGAGCLLCMAAASAANSSLTKHTQTLGNEDLIALKQGTADRLRKKGVDVTVIAENLSLKQLKDFSGGGTNVALKDFRPLKDKYNLDRLVVIDITEVGIVRNYKGYFPSGEPLAQLRAKVSVINLSTNAYDYYREINESKGAAGPWDEPPDFPNLSNAYYSVIESSKDDVQKPF